MKKMVRSIIVAALLAQPVFAWAQNEVEITTREIKQHITFLASDSLKGRKPGTPEGRTTAEYIARSFSACGLKLMGEKGFQYFEGVTAVQSDEKNRLTFDNFQGELGKDFVPIAFSENAAVTPKVVFAGYRFDFENDSLLWRDYEGMKNMPFSSVIPIRLRVGSRCHERNRGVAHGKSFPMMPLTAKSIIANG